MQGTPEHLNDAVITPFHAVALLQESGQHQAAMQEMGRVLKRMQAQGTSSLTDRAVIYLSESSHVLSRAPLNDFAAARQALSLASHYASDEVAKNLQLSTQWRQLAERTILMGDKAAVHVEPVLQDMAFHQPQGALGDVHREQARRVLAWHKNGRKGRSHLGERFDRQLRRQKWTDRSVAFVQGNIGGVAGFMAVGIGLPVAGFTGVMVGDPVTAFTGASAAGEVAKLAGFMGGALGAGHVIGHTAERVRRRIFPNGVRQQRRGARRLGAVVGFTLAATLSFNAVSSIVSDALGRLLTPPPAAKTPPLPPGPQPKLDEIQLPLKPL